MDTPLSAKTLNYWFISLAHKGRMPSNITATVTTTWALKRLQDIKTTTHKKHKLNLPARTLQGAIIKGHS